MNSTRSQEFGQLRARIEATFSAPAMVVVTSAASGDGKSATAFGLAESLAAAHHRVLLVDANAGAPTLPRIHRLPVPAARLNVLDVSRYAAPVAGHQFEGVSLADPRFESGLSMEAVRSAAADLRSHFDFVIVDAAQLVKSDLAVLFATVADGTFLTLRIGRLPSRADEETVKTLKRVGASVMGLLTVAPAMIKAFAATREEVSPTLRVPARHVTSRHTMTPDTSRTIVESPRSSVVTEQR
jgi:succinoglycan biosynthesis transport protein ExoP